MYKRQVKTDDDDLNAYANEICELLEAQNVRVDLDNRSEKLGYRMREGQIPKVPYLSLIHISCMETLQGLSASELSSVEGRKWRTTYSDPDNTKREGLDSTCLLYTSYNGCI